MKKGRKAALERRDRDLTKIAQATAAVLNEARTRAQAPLAQPAFRKFANSGEQVKPDASVWHRRPCIAVKSQNYSR
jgi:hypothetical protein